MVSALPVVFGVAPPRESLNSSRFIAQSSYHVSKYQMAHLASLSNPLITVEQLSSSSSQLDGVSSEIESSVRLAGALLTQAAGILLRLPQQLIAQAIVIFTRFYVGPEGGSFLFNAAQVVI